MLQIYHLMQNLKNIIILADTTVKKKPINDIKVKYSQLGQKGVIFSKHVLHRYWEIGRMAVFIILVM